VSDNGEEVCATCFINFRVPAEMQTARRSDGGDFYCPNGHVSVYNKGRSKEDLLRAERDQLKQRQAQLQDAVADEKRLRQAAERDKRCAEIDRAAAQQKLVKLKKRHAASDVSRRRHGARERGVADKEQSVVSDFSCTSTVKAVRKRHRCEHCGVAIEMGESASRTVGSYCGDFYTTYLHIDCNEAGLEFADLIKCWGEDFVWLHELYDLGDLQWLKEKYPVVAKRLNADSIIARFYTSASHLPVSPPA
jgi:hypothetical protein